VILGWLVLPLPPVFSFSSSALPASSCVAVDVLAVAVDFLACDCVTCIGLSAEIGQVRTVCTSTDLNCRCFEDETTDARDVCEDCCCLATASLRDSINDRFFSARICCTLCSSFHFEQAFEDAAWLPLQLTQCSALWQSASSCPLSPQRAQVCCPLQCDLPCPNL